MFRIPEVELDLEAQPIEVDKLLIAQVEIAAAEHDLGSLLRTQMGFDDDDDIDPLRKGLVQRRLQLLPRPCLFAGHAGYGRWLN